MTMTALVADRFVFDPFSAELIEDPYGAYRVLRDDLPVYYNPERDLWFLSRFEDVQAAARDHVRFSNEDGIDIDETGPQFGEGVLVEIDPPRHDVLRRIVRPDFVPKAVAELEQRIRSHVNRYVSSLLEGGGGDAVADMTWRLPIDVMGDLLGVPEVDRPRLSDLLVEFLVRVPGGRQIPGTALEAGEQLRVYFSALVQEQRLRPTGKLTERLVEAERAGELSAAETEGLCFFFFGAGTDSPSDLFSTTLHLLEVSPDQRLKLCKDRSLIPSAIEEVLRFDAPFQNYARTAKVDVEIRDQLIPESARVVLLSAAANRDGRRWPDPDVFDIERDQKRHLTFGEGIHFCIGAVLTRLEAKVLLEVVFERIPDYAIVEPVLRTTKQNSRGFRRLGIAI